ncbi:unnamed protein product [Penicillium pancosmium]
MPSTPERGSSPANLDDLFNYDVGLDDIFAENNDTNVDNANSKGKTGDPSSLGLGLDEEVKVTKKRQPVAKLDENRLLSQSGIPKLRQSAKKKLRFKGKGHEFSDAARLLNFYQLWLDELFPRAKFADGLAMIEKLGHTKRIQTMRREWIEEEKPKLFRDDPEPTIETLDLPTRLSSNQNQNGETQAQAGPSGDADADADQLFIPDPEADTRQQPTSHPEPDDDELDDLEDLLREQDNEMSGIQQTSGPGPQRNENSMDDFDADYEAMNELGL